MTIRGVTAASCALLSGVLFAACGGPSKQTHQSPSPTVTTRTSAVSWQNQPPGKVAGNQVAQKLLNAAVLPPGSQRLGASPTPVLDKPFTTVVDDNFLDQHAWWKVKLGTSALLNYLRTHQSKALTVSVTGGGVSGPQQPTAYSLEFDVAHPLTAAPDLQFTVVSAGAGASWLRVDGQTIWYPARPAKETAPNTGVVVLRITSGPTRTVTSAAAVSRLATEFNALRRTTPGTSGGLACTPNTRTLSISFTKRAETSPAITASRSGCASAWTVHGASGVLPALDGAGDLLTDALRSLGLSPNGLYEPPK